MFSGFCRKIGVSDIREYEERQLKVAQEESQARLRFNAQIARLSHAYVSFLVQIGFAANMLKTLAELNLSKRG